MERVVPVHRTALINLGEDLADEADDLDDVSLGVFLRAAFRLAGDAVEALHAAKKEAERRAVEPENRELEWARQHGASE